MNKNFLLRSELVRKTLLFNVIFKKFDIFTISCRRTIYNALYFTEILFVFMKFNRITNTFLAATQLLQYSLQSEINRDKTFQLGISSNIQPIKSGQFILTDNLFERNFKIKISINQY